MKIEMYPAGLLGTNCYFLINEDNNNCLVVDPGGDGESLAEKILNNDLKCCGILLTHGHCDHADGVDDLKNALGDVKAYALDKEKETLEDYKINMSRDVGYGKKAYSVDEFLSDGDELTLGGMSFKVIATPGHTAGGCCFYFENEGVLASGDTLFRQSVGRSDFPGGSMDDLTASIKEKLYILPDDTKVLPGHMSATTIGFEKEHNMFVR